MTVEISPETLAEYGYVYSTMEHILSTVEQLYLQAGVDLPARRYVAVGDVGSTVYDCEQVTVNFVQGYLGTPGQPAQQPSGCELAMSGDFVVQVVRCVPEMKTVGSGPRAKFVAPSAASISASSLVQAVDAQLLLEASWSMVSLQGTIATVGAGGASGQYQPIILNLSLSLIRD